MYVTLSRLRSKAQIVVHNLCTSTTLVVDHNIHTIPKGIHHQQQQNKPSMTLEYTVDVERFSGLNVRSVNPIEVSAKILLCCLGQKCLLFSVIKERCLYSRKHFHGTIENCENHKSLAQRIFPFLWQLIFL